MATVVLTSVTTDQDGKVRIRFDNGAELEFNSLAEVQAWALLPDTSVDLTQQLCVAYAINRSPDLSNLASVQGRTFTFDLSNNNPIRVTG